MSVIIRRGRVPQTPHTEFRAVDGVLALEEIHGTYGFSGPFSRKMHLRSYPTELSKPPKKADFDLTPKAVPGAEVLQPYNILTGRMPYGADAVRSRRALVFGPNTTLSVAKPVKDMPARTFFRNGARHEAWFVQEGEGVLASEYGELKFRKGHYLIVPKGVTYRVELASDRAWFLVIESVFPITFPPHYMNSGGQAKMMAPVVETEVEAPVFQKPVDQRGEFFIDVKHGAGAVTRLTLSHHPFDLAGWEGALYPFALDIARHHGVAREIHTAPPMHQTFEAGTPPHSGFSICSFVPQMEGWHPKEVPAPYAHLNVDSDECMFFSNASYGARKGVIEDGAFTFHPGSVPHSPHGLAALRSLAARGTTSKRLAVMVDTFFESLQVAEAGWKHRDPTYALSWFRLAEAEAGAKEGAWISASE